MTASDRIRIEVFEGSQAGDAEFDSRARTYVRSRPWLADGEPGQGCQIRDGQIGLGG